MFLEIHSTSSGPDISRLIWKPTVHFHANNSFPLLLIQSQMIHSVSCRRSSSVHFNIIPLPTPMSSAGSVSFTFSNPKYIYFFRLSKPSNRPTFFRTFYFVMLIKFSQLHGIYIYSTGRSGVEYVEYERVG